MKLFNQILILIICIPTAFIALVYIYGLYNRFAFWLKRKFILFIAGVALLKCKNKEIREIGWITMRLVFWETKEDRVEIKKISEEED